MSNSSPISVRRVLILVGVIAAACLSSAWRSPVVCAEENQAQGLTMIVMDPLAAPLACDCVQGYAQRKYEELGKYLEKSLGCPVHVHWSESLAVALKETDRRADLVIGKDSVVRANAKEVGMQLVPLARLSDKEGKTTQTGLLVVRTADTAQVVEDLKGYRIFFGPDDCDEKSAAPKRLLKQAGIELPELPETCGACSVAALKLIELPESTRAAAVISSYAEPLLKGCGTIGEGELRVVGTTEPVPFITAFARKGAEPERLQALRRSLMAVAKDSALLKSLESRNGFLAVKRSKVSKSAGGSGAVERTAVDR